MSPVQPAQRSSQASALDYAEIEATAIPVEQVLVPGAQPDNGLPTGTPSAQSSPEGPPQFSGAYAGPSFRSMVDEALYREIAAEAEAQGQAAPVDIGPQNYGQDQLNSPYHYNDYRQFPRPTFYPERAVGRLFFQKPDGAWYTCTATLIERNILLTAGHCVYDGDPFNDGTWNEGPGGWNLAGYFVPSYSDGDNGNHRFGRCDVTRWSTTSGWYNNGELNRAYDIGLAVCGNLFDARIRRFNGDRPGAALGYLSFCLTNCRQSYWFLSQFGYPGNYYDGGEMTVSQHIEIAGQANPVTGSTTGRDYLYGTGMRGGSSGGPHISNVGAIDDSASAGQWPMRNVIFAVTSWGYVSDVWKIQGASPLSGYNNDINMMQMFNQICRVARRTLGSRSCSLLRS